MDPKDFGNTTNNYIGRSQWPDPYLDGSIDEFKIYNYALSELDIKKLYDSTPDPKVTLTSPVTNDVLLKGNPVKISAEATAWDATISKVQFYDSTALIGEDATSPYEITLTYNATGNHKISAKVIDSKSQSGVSDTNTITVIRTMALHYPFDNTVNDVSGNANHGVATGTPQYDTGKVDTSIVLNGTDQYVSLPADFRITAKSVTISGWINPAQIASWTRVFDFGSSTSIYMFLTLSANGSPRFTIKNGGGEEIVNSNTAFTTGVWSHFAITYNDKVCRFYLNGNLVGENTYMKTKPADLGVLSTSYIGKSQYTADPLYSGRLDDFKVYDYALTPSEIADLVAGKSIPNGTYIITARHSGKVLDVLNDGRTNGSNVQQYQSNGCGCQQWILTHQANGQYTIAGVNSGKNLDVNGSSTADGANVQIWQATGADNQKFTIRPVDDGYYRITAAHSGKVVDVSGASTANKANVHQWTWLGALNQQWQFVPADSSARVTTEPVAELVNDQVDDLVRIFPNPVSDRVTVRLQAFEKGATVSLYHVNGQLLYTSTASGTQHTLNMSKFSPGLYVIKVVNGPKCITKKISKK